jgi:hypothetical protein
VVEGGDEGVDGNLEERSSKILLQSGARGSWIEELKQRW